MKYYQTAKADAVPGGTEVVDQTLKALREWAIPRAWGHARSTLNLGAGNNQGATRVANNTSVNSKHILAEGAKDA